MIKIQNHYGAVEISDTYLANLLGNTVSTCFGVVGMATSSVSQGFRSTFLNTELPDKGIRVRTSDGKLIIDLHIILTYGVNIRAISDSIINKVSYTVERATGLLVDKVNVYVDGLAS